MSCLLLYLFLAQQPKYIVDKQITLPVSLNKEQTTQIFNVMRANPKYSTNLVIYGVKPQGKCMVKVFVDGNFVDTLGFPHSENKSNYLINLNESLKTFEGPPKSVTFKLIPFDKSSRFGFDEVRIECKEYLPNFKAEYKYD